ncbi:Uncharacterized conserved protein involved in oxidation of intracellular sulfur [gamma proteobacterium HdN1]|nr:Uncharacterized conserved protein involved in oxidation of intracellular sulfur [gamma proteobacterium HdN1]
MNPNNSTLHLVSASPFESPALADCLRVLQGKDSLLLIQNGVWAAHREQSWRAQLQFSSEHHRIYVLAEDAALRGIHVLPPFELVDYEGMVALACEHARSASWY